MARQRAEQRLREGRAKPVDVLAANLFLSAEFDPSVTAPYAVFDGLQLNDVRDLADDIRGMQVQARPRRACGERPERVAHQSTPCAAAGVVPVMSRRLSMQPVCAFLGGDLKYTRAVPWRQAARAAAQELDSRNAEHAEYWAALATVAEAELAAAQRQDDADRARLRGEAPPADDHAGGEAGLHGAVDADIHLMLAGAFPPRAPCGECIHEQAYSVGRNAMRGWEDKLPASAPGASGAAGRVRAWGLLLTLEETLHWVSCCIALACSGFLKTVALIACLLHARMGECC